MKRFISIAVFGLTAAVATGAAAGCSPKCAEGSTCRYEAAGGKYYCAPNKAFMQGISKGGMQGREVTMGGAARVQQLIKR